MGVSNVRGAISGVSGTIEWDEKNPTKSTVSTTLDANTISTSNDARDKHLKSPDFFDVAKYPTLTFKSTGVQVVGPGKLKISGMLQLGGQTKPSCSMWKVPWARKRYGWQDGHGLFCNHRHQAKRLQLRPEIHRARPWR